MVKNPITRWPARPAVIRVITLCSDSFSGLNRVPSCSRVLWRALQREGNKLTLSRFILQVSDIIWRSLRFTTRMFLCSRCQDLLLWQLLFQPTVFYGLCLCCRDLQRIWQVKAGLFVSHLLNTKMSHRASHMASNAAWQHWKSTSGRKTNRKQEFKVKAHLISVWIRLSFLFSISLRQKPQNSNEGTEGICSWES